MATFTTAAAVLASPPPCRPAALIARSPAASPSRWTPLRSSSPAVGLQRAAAPLHRGSTLLKPSWEKTATIIRERYDLEMDGRILGKVDS